MIDTSRANKIIGEKSCYAMLQTLKTIGTLDDLMARLTEIGVADGSFKIMVVDDFRARQRQRQKYIREKSLERSALKKALQLIKKYGIVIRDDKGRGTRLKKIQSQARDG